jgi:superfamily I DNA/RNA helicase
VIDEAQDLPVSFYQALGLLVVNCDKGSSFCIVADENQRLQEHHNSSINDIRNAVILAGSPQEYLLRRNYRNTYEIAVLAQRFYVGLESGNAELPESRRGQKPRMVGYSKGLNGMCDAIKRHASNNPTHSILVVCPTPRLVKKMRNKIEARLSGRTVKAYLSNDDTHVAKDLETGRDGSVTVLHWRSMKGVEADAVFVPQLEAFDLGGDSTEGEKMRLYVLMSRARQILELQYDHTGASNGQTRLIATIRELAGDVLEEHTI